LASFVTAVVRIEAAITHTSFLHVLFRLLCLVPHFLFSSLVLAFFPSLFRTSFCANIFCYLCSSTIVFGVRLGSNSVCPEDEGSMFRRNVSEQLLNNSQNNAISSTLFAGETSKPVSVTIIYAAYTLVLIF
jgi:hypothetical protein